MRAVFVFGSIRVIVLVTTVAGWVCETMPYLRFISSHVEPLLAPGEVILHAGYLTTNIEGGTLIGAITLRACFIAITETRAFFLWNKPGRVGVFRPLRECSGVQVVSRTRIAGRIERSALLSRALYVSLDGEVVSFYLKRKIRSLPDQARVIDALITIPLVRRSFWEPFTFGQRSDEQSSGS